MKKIYSVIVIVCVAFLIKFINNNFTLFPISNKNLTTDKIIELNGGSILNNHCIPFVFDSNSIGIETYTDLDYGLDIISVKLDSIELKPTLGSGKTSLFGEKTKKIVHSPFVWMCQIGAITRDNENSIYKNNAAGLTWPRVTPPEGGESWLYHFDMLKCRDSVEIEYKLRSVIAGKIFCKYKLIINFK